MRISVSTSSPFTALTRGTHCQAAAPRPARPHGTRAKEPRQPPPTHRRRLSPSWRSKRRHAAARCPAGTSPVRPVYAAISSATQGRAPRAARHARHVPGGRRAPFPSCPPQEWRSRSSVILQPRLRTCAQPQQVRPVTEQHRGWQRRSGPDRGGRAVGHVGDGRRGRGRGHRTHSTRAWSASCQERKLPARAAVRAGVSTANAPHAVATPFPPRNFSQIGYTWPTTAASPATAGAAAPPPDSRCATQNADRALRDVQHMRRADRPGRPTIGTRWWHPDSRCPPAADRCCPTAAQATAQREWTRCSTPARASRLKRHLR